jgi:hypothetical protein
MEEVQVSKALLKGASNPHTLQTHIKRTPSLPPWPGVGTQRCREMPQHLCQGVLRGLHGQLTAVVASTIAPPAVSIVAATVAAGHIMQAEQGRAGQGRAQGRHRVSRQTCRHTERKTQQGHGTTCRQGRARQGDNKVSRRKRVSRQRGKQNRASAGVCGRQD